MRRDTQTSRSAPLGLEVMLGSSFRFEQEALKVLRESTSLEDHPFGLKVMNATAFVRSANRVYLVSNPGWTDGSVRALATVALDAAAYSPVSIHYLRVIKAEAEAKGHYLLFEVATHNGTFIAGGCTDFSGEGSGGAESLEHLFTFLSLVYRLKIERATIPAPQSNRSIEAIWAAYNAAHNQHNGSAA